MPIQAWVRHGDHTKIKSVAVPGKRSRYIERPTRKNASPRAIKVMECEDHSSPHPTVPVELIVYYGPDKAPEKVGDARACPFCWEIIAPIKKVP